MRPQRTASSEPDSESAGYRGEHPPPRALAPAAAAAVRPQAHVPSYFEAARAHRPHDAGPDRPAGKLAHGAAQRKRRADVGTVDSDIPAARPCGGAEPAAGAGGKAGGGQRCRTDHGSGRLALMPEVIRDSD